MAQPDVHIRDLGMLKTLPSPVLPVNPSEMGSSISKRKGNQDIVIIVAGATGAGKSSLINTAVGYDAVVVGHSLKPCTTRVKSVQWCHRDRRIVLVDTPALDDDCPDFTPEVLEKQLKKWMNSADVQQATGILYLHKITDNRIPTPSARTMAAFRSLCGTHPDISSKIMLVTTMWDKIRLDVGEPREEEIKTKYLSAGCRVVHFDKSPSSVWTAVDLIIG